MIHTEPTTPSPQQPPPHTVAPLAEAALVAQAAPGAVAVLEPPAGRPLRGSWPDDDYRGWAGL